MKDFHTKDQFPLMVLMMNNYYFRKFHNLNETTDRNSTSPAKQWKCIKLIILSLVPLLVPLKLCQNSYNRRFGPFTSLLLKGGKKEKVTLHLLSFYTYLISINREKLLCEKACGKNLVFGNTDLGNAGFQFVASYIANSNKDSCWKKNHIKHQ